MALDLSEVATAVNAEGGRRYPNEIEHPYWGYNIEQSTLTEYKEGFNCPAVDCMY